MSVKTRNLFVTLNKIKLPQCCFKCLNPITRQEELNGIFLWASLASYKNQNSS